MCTEGWVLIKEEFPCEFLSRIVLQGKQFSKYKSNARAIAAFSDGVNRMKKMH
jgi:hypothetical protein